MIGNFGRVARISSEEILNIFLGRQHRAPRRLTTGAIAESAQHGATFGVIVRAQPCMTGRRPRNIDLAECGDAPVIGAIELNAPHVFAPDDFDNRMARRGHFDVDILLLQAVKAMFGKSGKHQVVTR